MILRKDATLRDLRQAASLQAWHFQQMLAKSEFSPFQQAYFLKELADGCISITEGIITEHDLSRMMAEAAQPEVEPTPKPTPKRPRRTRKPQTKPTP